MPTPVLQQSQHAFLCGQSTPAAVRSLTGGFGFKRPRHGTFAAFGHAQGDLFQESGGFVMVWEGLNDLSKTTVEVPPFQRVGPLPKAGFPEPAVEPHLVMEGGSVRPTAVSGLQVDEAGRSVPSEHHVQFTGSPTFWVKHALWLTDPWILDPRSNDFPSFGMIHGGAFLLPAEEAFLLRRIKMRRPPVRKGMLRPCSIGRGRDVEHPLVSSHGRKVWTTADLHATVHLDHQEFDRRPDASGQVFLCKRPTGRLPFTAPRQSVPPTEAFFTDEDRFFFGAAPQPRQQTIAVHARRCMAHDQANHAVLENVPENL